jgi:hypothetical protein
MRFFMRAIANYDEGLQKHPAAFDLAYNKYVQYSDPKINYDETICTLSLPETH